MPLTADTWPDSGTDSGCALTPTYSPLLPAHPPAAWQFTSGLELNGEVLGSRHPIATEVKMFSNVIRHFRKLKKERG